MPHGGLTYFKYVENKITWATNKLVLNNVATKWAGTANDIAGGHNSTVYTIMSF